jgi:DNA-directed RNA polymerase subunit RPC12/RpoP
LFGADAERARQIIFDPGLRLSEEVNIRCAQCGSHNIARDFPKNLTSKLSSSLRFLFFGIFYPGKKVYRCTDCEFEFQGD